RAQSRAARLGLRSMVVRRAPARSSATACQSMVLSVMTVAVGSGGMTLLGLSPQPSAGVGLDEQDQDLADRALSPDGLRERQMPLHTVAVATPVPVLDDVARLDEVGHDAVGAALRDPDRGGQVPQPEPGITGDADEHAGVVGEETPFPHVQDRNKFLETNC